MCGFILHIGSPTNHRTGLMFHRGPDEQTLITEPDFQLEFSRLAITGTLDGRVPVYSDNKEWIIAFNGEIYNYKSLIKDWGLPWTDSDTRVIAEGISRFGINFLAKLRGMYAGVAVNILTKEKFIFRDPLGEKPLFYTFSKDGIWLSSEFAPLLRILDRPLKPNPAAFSNYFRFGYAEEPLTFDLEISTVTRGSILKIVNGNSLELITELPGYDSHETSLPLEDLISVVNSEVVSSTVPTGLALSGGIDSTSLLFALKKYRENEFIPIIMNVNKAGFSSESIQALECCEKLGINPSVVSSPSDSQITDYLLRLATRNDQPHSDPSGLSYFQIFERSFELGQKVIVLGHGPDEFFWGYPWYNNKINSAASKFAFRRKEFTRTFWDTPAKSKKLLRFLPPEIEKRHWFATDRFLLSEDPWERFRAEISHNYLSDNGLRQSDRLAMSFGVEPRTPYGDSRLYGWAQMNSLKNINSFDKSEFRKAVELGPFESMRFKEKQGFNSTFDSWFSLGDVNELGLYALGQILNLDLPWKSDIKFNALNKLEKYRILMLGLWIQGLK